LIYWFLVTLKSAVLRIRLVIFFIKYNGLFFSFFLRLRNQSIYCKDIPRVLYLKTGMQEIVLKQGL